MADDVIVIGAGPAGLAAALSLVRAGIGVTLVEGAGEVGGLCATVRRGERAFDLGGHILFVHDARREAWLRELLGDRLRWVDRPVVCTIDGAIRPGRYLDQRGDGPGPLPAGVDGGPSAADLLGGAVGAATVDRLMRRYLEKVDGMPLERITAARARKLLVEQYAPDGFWFPDGGIGVLMAAMARAIVAGRGTIRLHTRVDALVHDGARVTGVRVSGPDGTATLPCAAVIAGVPAGAVAALADPAPPPEATPRFPVRAAAIVALEVDAPALTEHAWIQIDDPRVPFARVADFGNWSPAMTAPGRSVVTCEIYCDPTPTDPFWPLDDAQLSRACADALVGVLGLVDARTPVRRIEVVRRARAWSLVDVDRADEALAPARWLDALDGVHVAQGGDVVTALDAGERAAVAALHGGW